MPPRILTPEGETHIGWPKAAIHALYGEEDGYRTTFRMPHALQSEASRLREFFRSSHNDVYLIALARYIDGFPADGERMDAVPGPAGGRVADGQPSGRLDLLNELLRTPRAWTVADRDSLKDFRDRVVDSIALILVERAPMAGDIAWLIDELPLALKEEAVLAGAMLDEDAILDILRPRLRAERRHVIDDVCYVFGRLGDALTLTQAEAHGRPRIVR